MLFERVNGVRNLEQHNVQTRNSSYLPPIELLKLNV